MDFIVLNGVQVNILAVLFGLCFSISAWSVYRMRLFKSHFSRELDKFHMELASIESGSLGVGKRLVDVEKRLQGNVVKQEEVEFGFSPYSKATNMFGGGSDITDVIKACGISRPEAELMQLMHRQMKRYGPAPK